MATSHIHILNMLYNSMSKDSNIYLSNLSLSHFPPCPLISINWTLIYPGCQSTVLVMTIAKVLRRGAEEYPRYSRVKQQSSYKHVGGHADRIERTLRALTTKRGHMRLGRDLKAEGNWPQKGHYAGREDAWWQKGPKPWAALRPTVGVRNQHVCGRWRSKVLQALKQDEEIVNVSLHRTVVTARFISVWRNTCDCQLIRKKAQLAQFHSLQSRITGTGALRL